jgi:hypothetical protein
MRLELVSRLEQIKIIKLHSYAPVLFARISTRQFWSHYARKKCLRDSINNAVIIRVEARQKLSSF